MYNMYARIWLIVKKFLTSTCLMMAPYLNVKCFGSSQLGTKLGEVAKDRCSKLC